MGACAGKSKPKQIKVPLPTVDQVIMEMKMTAKRYMTDSSKAQKQQKQEIKKAKLSLKKNNEEGAKMYLASASSKHIQANNLQRMSLKMQTLAITVKNNNSNQVLIKQYNNLTNLMSTTSQPNTLKLATDLNAFQNKMDEIFINAKIMDEIIHHENNTGNIAQGMMEKLKLEMALQTQNQFKNIQQKTPEKNGQQKRKLNT